MVSLDWPSVASTIAATIGHDLSASTLRSLNRGSKHATWQIDDGQRQYFLKTGDADASPMFAGEARGLGALESVAAIRTPAVLTYGTGGQCAFILLEWLDLAPLSHTAGSMLGRALAQQHRCFGETFGWSEHNFIGTTPQFNTPHPSWPHFFATCRLRPQLDLALARGLDKGLHAKGMAIADRLGGLFVDYRPHASLLHGDLWSGNVGQLAGSEPAIFDPACFWGDRETDIAMSELFGGFPTSFHAAYRAEWPLDAGYERRKPLYNLYHILNHYNLFGEAYLGQARRMIDRLLTDLRR